MELMIMKIEINIDIPDEELDDGDVFLLKLIETVINKYSKKNE